MFTRKTSLLGTFGVISLLLAGAPSLTAGGEAAVKAAASSAGIQIDNFHYLPPMLVVAPGTTVTWKNDDDSPHSVREKDGKFKSSALDTDETFSQTFTAPGEYEYFCSIHPYMTGKIVVKSAGSS